MVETALAPRRMHGVRIAPTFLVVFNLCFADDTVLFCQPSVQEAVEVLNILDTYAKMSGQIINLEKSSLILSPNTNQALRASLQQRLQIQVVDCFD